MLWSPAGLVLSRIAVWATVIAAPAIVSRAPSIPVALAGFVIGLATIEIGAGPESSRARSSTGLIPACLSYLAIRLAVDLVPQAGWIADVIALGGCRYVNSTRGLNVDLSFTALGGPAVGLAGLNLLWGWRCAGGIGRVVAAIVIPLAWFALSPIVTPDVAAGPVAAFTRGACHGLFWLGVAGVLDAFLSAAPRLRVKPMSARIGLTRRRGAAEEEVTRARALASGGSGTATTDRNDSRRLSMAVAGAAAALAGVCLVGTAYIGPAAGRSVRVYNRGGLDWERPVFGRFGGFSGGMFGLWPVYSRAEGYDFSVVCGLWSVVCGPWSVVRGPWFADADLRAWPENARPITEG